MAKTRRPTLSSAPFRASLTVILALAVFIGIFWIINEYQTYQESIANIQQNYKELYQTRAREEANSVLDFIEQRRSQADLRIENELRVKVQSAYTIASHIYRMYREEKDMLQLRSMVAEILRPIRWDNGLGYYFAGRIEEDVIDLFANDPLLEGQSLCQLKDQTGKPVALNIVKMLKEKGAGIFRHKHMEDDSTSKCFPGITFVKYFQPFDWYIGAGISSAAMEKNLQEEILATVQDIQFGGDGHILCFRFDGTIISHQNKNFIGRSVTDLTDIEGKTYGQTLLKTGLENSSGGYVLYRSAKMYPDEGQQRLSFIKAYPEWNWILAADISMDAMAKAIHDETLTYTAISFKNVFIFIGLFAIAVLLLLSMTYYHSIKIKHGISLFTDFFRKAAHTQVKIQDTDLAFSEFEDLGRLANAMVDDRIEKERILHRDELRLDTLLQLGSMDEFDINDKYDFVLHRIVQITGSTRGYIALVNHAQTHTTLCSQVTIGLGQVGLSPDDDSINPRRLADSGLIGSCIRQQKVCIVNDGDKTNPDAYPYSQKIERRVDVPISNNNQVVLVAGVCNSSKDYDNSDVRQMTMLLEGMWLHVLKTCSEKEMANLERQIIAISEEERSKIGRDLHDDLGSHLSGVEILSKVLQQRLETHAPKEAGQLSTIRDLIREAIEKTRWLSRGLYPVHVIEHGLEAAIEELVAEIEQLYPVHCRLSFDRRAEPLASNIAPHVYYIIREALFNAARHGRPDTIRIIILRHDNRLSVTIIDDGQGIPEQGRKKGLGLHTMQYRAKAIGATLDIRPGDNNGTLVTLYGEVFS
ncbi:MAG: cache domain-containing protein [Proteobacteria bacterium]|nr:cache domain-containing protein [Pseudomonadota bacterium]MBU1420755.1 cache domain-containing protein [Pseudomonadota bacterium]MBU1456400.1 cache domain-containing protein [Pseudomonadota bacterium]